MKIILGLTLALAALSASAQSRLSSLTGDTFDQLAELTGTQAGGDFGYSIAVSGSTLVVGAPLATAPGGCSECGAAYVYTAVNGDWTNLVQVATLTQSGGESAPGGFGGAVAISGDTIVVAGLLEAYLYVNPSGNSTQTAELTVSSSSGSGGIYAVAIDGPVVVVGTPVALAVSHEEGAAFVYVEPSTGWANMSQTAELVSKDFDRLFGVRVAVSGRDVVVGATEVTIGGVEQGAAYLFVEPTAGWSGIWAPTTEFEASNGTRKAEFGGAVSVSGDTVAVGAPDEAVGSSQNEGAVYIFTRPLSGWPKTMTETAELTAGKAGSEFGYSVALSGKELVAGAPFEHSNQGFVYAFTEPAGGWQNGASAEEITAADGAADNNFGYSVDFGGGVIAVGAIQWPSGGGNASGAAYIFSDAQ